MMCGDYVGGGVTCSEGIGVVTFVNRSSITVGLPPREDISWSSWKSVHHMRRFCSRSIALVDSAN
jgi:hypothetical protein